MPYQRLTYRFSAKLAAPRPRAYGWATDYRSDDFELSGLPATRRVEKLTEDLVLLTDTFDDDPFDARTGVRTVKVKLVHLFPDRWMWTSTHVAGPAQYSQFLYQLTSRGNSGCTLHFTGSQVERVNRRPSRASLAHRTQELRHADSQLWVRLAAALAKERARRAVQTSGNCTIDPMRVQSGLLSNPPPMRPTRMALSAQSASPGESAVFR